MASPTTTQPDWLTARRAHAFDTLATLALPSFRGTPGWEFTPIDTLDLDAYPAARASPDMRDALDTPPNAQRATLNRGETGEPLVLPLEVAARLHSELVEGHLGAAVPARTAFVARNDAHWSDGWLVYVPAHTHVTEPIVLSTLHQPSSTLHHRLLVILEEGADAEVWTQQLSAQGDGEGVANGVVELFVGAGARLRFLDLQDLSEHTWIFAAARAIVERDGQLDWTALGFGATNGKVFLETQLAGPGAHAAITGAYATRGRQHLDFDTRQEHAAPNTTSDLAFRGIIAQRSSSVWRGMIKVDPDAQRTDAFQESRNLLLSKHAHADAIPGLEILANDVRCTHAAAIAQIDPEQLFYLQTHGLPNDHARHLIIEGFLQALLERHRAGDLRDALARALSRRIELVLSPTPPTATAASR
ncbi:MAG: Fe-S cluster assembly protein SufD [Solirubrobacteraceae bacterium]